MRSDNSHKMLYLKNFKHETRSHSHSIWSRSSRERSFEIFHSVRLQQILAIFKRVKIFKIGNTRLSIRKTLSLLNSRGRFARGFQKQYNRLQLFLNTKDTICDKCQQDIEGYVCSILHFFCINIHLKKKVWQYGREAKRLRRRAKCRRQTFHSFKYDILERKAKDNQ